MTHDEAEAMLKQLSAHYGEPVMPIRKYCTALQTWATAMHGRARRAKIAAYPAIGGENVQAGMKACRTYHEDQKIPSHESAARERGKTPTKRHRELDRLRELDRESSAIEYTFLQIQKSNLLSRILYGGQSVRTVPCPVHKGTWSGCQGTKQGETGCACMDGSNVTGWLP